MASAEFGVREWHHSSGSMQTKQSTLPGDLRGDLRQLLANLMPAFGTNFRRGSRNVAGDHSLGLRVKGCLYVFALTCMESIVAG